MIVAEALSVAGEGAVCFGRRPDSMPPYRHSRRLTDNSQSPYKFAYARTALKYGLIASGLRHGDSLLVPELICTSALEPLHQLGIEPQYYPVKQTLEPDWPTIEKTVSKSTKALLVVHYFGQPQDIQTCVQFCQDHSLLLIEDNAHGYGGIVDGQLIGTFSDIGFSAPRKNFPIINGAYLYLSNGTKPDLSGLTLQPRDSISIKRRVLSQIKKFPVVHSVVMRRDSMREQRKRSGPAVPYGSQEAFRDTPLADDYGMDETTETFLNQQDIEKIRSIRHEIYHLWKDLAESNGLAPVFPNLSPGAMPLVFPAYSESACDSLQWYERGHRAGVDIHSWPTLPREIVQRDSGAMRLWERLVCFPIHQDMDIRLLEKRMAVV